MFLNFIEHCSLFMLNQGQEGQWPDYLQAEGQQALCLAVSGKYFGFDTISINLDFLICPQLWIGLIINKLN